MYRSQGKFNLSNLAKTCLSLMPLLVPAVAVQAVAQDSLPLVYDVENTGAHHAAPTFPSFDKLPIIRPLPDPFVFFKDGRRDTRFSSWEERRNEIFGAVQKYMLGPKPDCHDCTITTNYVQNPTDPLRGTLTINVTRNGITATQTSAVTLPASGSGPFPYIIGFSASGTGSVPASLLTNVAKISFNNNQILTAFYSLYPELCAGAACNVAPNYGVGGSNSGQYAAWSWGVSRVIDAIEILSRQAGTALPLNTARSAVTGCSFGGKEALYAGAMDERIALTIAQENGGGGVPSWRFNQNVEAQAPAGTPAGASVGAVENINNTNYGWFSGQMFQFAGSNVYKLPIDQHELVAMIAPRAILQTGNTGYYWLGNGAAYVSSRAAQRVYDEFGIGDRFGWVIDGDHAHCAIPAIQQPQVAAFINRFLLDQDVSTDIKVQPNPYVQEQTAPPYYLPHGNNTGRYIGRDGNRYPTNYPYLFTTMDYGRWTSWWGSNKPEFPNNWNTGGTFDLVMNNQVHRINAGDTIAAGFAVSMPTAHPEATVQVPNGKIEMDIACPDGSSYTLSVPLPGQTFTIPANNNGWFPSPIQKSPLVYQGSATNPGCSSGAQGSATRAYFTAVGLQDGYAGDGAGPGFITTDTVNPSQVRFHLANSSNGSGGHWSETVTVNLQPLNQAPPPRPLQ